MSERTVTCPRCGQQVAVPTTGEKVRCPGCGQKFRFDTPQPPEAEHLPARERPPDKLPEQPQESEPKADTIACPRCGNTVEVPKTGEKVRCPGCGQKFRYQVKAPEPEPAPGPAPLPPAPPEREEPEQPPPEAEETDETEEAPELEEAAPGPIELVLSPRPASPPASLASELRTLWPALGALLERVYQDGKASEGDHIRFREEARRAGELARLFLPPADDQNQTPREFVLSVLPQMSLDEVIALSLEDFRNLSETFQETAQLLEAHLPGPSAPPARPTPAAEPQPQPAARTQPRPLISTTAMVAVVVLLGLLVVLILNLPELKRRLGALDQPRTRTVTVITETPRAPASATSAEPSTSPISQAPAKRGPHKPQPPPRDTEAPVSKNQKTRAPTTSSTPAPKPTTQATVVEKPVRVPSRWKPGPEGWITVFGGSRPDGLQLDPANWTVEKGLLVGRAPAGETAAAMREANWTDYVLEAELELDSKAEASVAHGSLRAILGDKVVRLLHRGRVLDELTKGLRRGKWYHVALDVAGPKVQVRINDKPALRTAGFDPSPGSPTVGARNGAVAFRSVRVKLRSTDPDYRAVVLGEGYIRPPGTTPAAHKPGAGTYKLFNGRDLAGWTPSGQWRVSSGAILGVSPSAAPATLVAGSPQWADYALDLKFRIVRQSAVPRDDEYALVIFRARDAQNFHCVRFAVEGIYEIGYYRSGRFHETSRARFGLGPRSKFNRWHSLSLTARGANLTMSIDGVGGMPPWPITTFPNGAVGIGVTAGQAAFQDISLKVLR